MDKLDKYVKELVTFFEKHSFEYLKEHGFHTFEALIHKSLEYIPLLERFLVDSLDAMFAPKQILRQMMIIAGIQVTLQCYNTISAVFTHVYHLVSAKGRKEQELLTQLANAKSYNEWKDIAFALDCFHGRDKWRSNDESRLYDYRLVRKRIKGTKEMLDRGDVFDLMFRIRGALARDQFGIQHEGLFTRAMSGTKDLIESYHETMARALNFICDSPIADEEIPTDAKLAFFNETRHAYGRTAILLSGGAYLGYYHMGVVRALYEEGVLPRVLSGASAGSIMTAIIGTRTDTELEELYYSAKDDQLPKGLRTDFFRYSNELKSEMARKLHYLVPQGLKWLTHPLFSSIFDKKILNLDTEHFKSLLMQNCGLWTFQEAFDRTGRIINIIVAPMNPYDPPRLLNYLTAPHVCVWSAAAASCAIPGIFDPITLIVKEPDGRFRPENEWTRQAHLEDDKKPGTAAHGYSDGSLEQDLPMEQLSELFNVNHFIVSQVNPHSAILSSMALKSTVWTNPVYGALVGYMRFLAAQCRDWLKNIVNFLVFRSNAPVWSTKRGITQTLTQDYEGRDNDITIMPWAGHTNTVVALTSAIKNPNGKEYCDISQAAERNTWPAIARIRAHCLIEMTLDQCVQRLRKRITEESERNREKMINSVLNQSANHRRGKLDRTPSFYTSRSIVNLSGLSVADPLPAAQATLAHSSGNDIASSGALSSNFNGKKRPSYGSSSQVAGQPGKLRSRSNSMNPDNAVASTNQTSSMSGFPRSSLHNVFDSVNQGASVQTFDDGDVDGELHTFDGLDDLNFEVRLGDTVPLQRTKSRSESGLGLAYSAHNSNENLEDHEQQHHIIHKTTNMASFYYKKGHSTDKLDKLDIPGATHVEDVSK